MKARYIRVILFFVLIGSYACLSGQSKPQRVILFMIDGLHWQAPEKLNMPVFNNLVEQGTYIRESYMILPHHPTIGDYSVYNSCSFPNPILHQGTVFLDRRNKMLQEIFSPKQQTAFIVNTVAYNSVARGYSTVVTDDTLTDDEVVDCAINILETQDPVFMRVHLQRAGQRGYDISQSSKEEPFFRNIFAPNSPYIQVVEAADKSLGKFVTYLKESGQWENSVLIISSDHGQSRIGWHALFDEDSWKTPLLFVGKNIAKNRKLSYFEHTDIAPTIAGLLDAKIETNGGSGVFVKEILASNKADNYNPPMYIKTINKQIKEYNLLKAELLLRSEENVALANIVALLENQAFIEPFYHQDRILDWHKAETTAHMIEANEKVLKRMRQALLEE